MAPKIRQATIADELAAGYSFPMRNALDPSAEQVQSMLQARRVFWLAVAKQYLAQAEAGINVDEALADATEALTQSDLYVL